MPPSTDELVIALLCEDWVSRHDRLFWMMWCQDDQPQRIERPCRHCKRPSRIGCQFRVCPSGLAAATSGPAALAVDSEFVWATLPQLQAAQPLLLSMQSLRKRQCSHCEWPTPTLTMLWLVISQAAKATVPSSGHAVVAGRLPLG